MMHCFGWNDNIAAVGVVEMVEEKEQDEAQKSEYFEVNFGS